MHDRKSGFCLADHYGLVDVLVHRANPDQRLEEIDYTNNDASLRVRLSWSGGVPRVETLRTCQGSADS